MQDMERARDKVIAYNQTYDQTAHRHARKTMPKPRHEDLTKHVLHSLLYFAVCIIFAVLFYQLSEFFFPVLVMVRKVTLLSKKMMEHLSIIVPGIKVSSAVYILIPELIYVNFLAIASVLKSLFHIHV